MILQDATIILRGPITVQPNDYFVNVTFKIANKHAKVTGGRLIPIDQDETRYKMEVQRQ